MHLCINVFPREYFSINGFSTLFFKICKKELHFCCVSQNLGDVAPCLFSIEGKMQRRSGIGGNNSSARATHAPSFHYLWANEYHQVNSMKKMPPIYSVILPCMYWVFSVSEDAVIFSVGTRCSIQPWRKWWRHCTQTAITHMVMKL